MEPVAGKWAFHADDEMLKQIGENHITLLPILAYNSRDISVFPAWSHLDQWSDYVRHVVTRYQKEVPCWEVWNEPNDSRFWGAPIRSLPGSAEHYTILLKRTYQEIKSINPNLKVLYCGIVTPPWEYIEKSFAAGAGNYFDVMNLHSYYAFGTPEYALIAKTRKLSAIMKKYGLQKPLWITEMGYSSASPLPLFTKVLPIALQRAGIKPEESTAAIVYDPNPGFEGAVNLLDQKCLNQFRAVDKITFAQLKDISPRKYSLLIPYGGCGAFPSKYIPDLLQYVAKGGTLFLPSDLPFYFDLVPDPSGEWQLRQVNDQYMAAFHIAWDTWWTRKDVPKKVTFVRPTPEFAGQLKEKMNISPKGFLSTRNLKGNDRFIPIIEAGTDQFKSAIAGLYKLDSDLKGNIIFFSTTATPNTTLESLQTEYLPRIYLTAFACGVDRVFWYNFRAMEWSATESEAHFGIVGNSLAPKPSYWAMKTLTSLCPSGSTRPVLKHDKNLFLASWTRPDGVKVWAYWAALRPEKVDIEIEGTVQKIVNHLGEPLKQANHTATGSICYLVGPKSVSLGNVFPKKQDEEADR